MAESSQSSGTLIDLDASEFAFRAGQLLHGLLMDRAIALAERQQPVEAMVGVAQVKASIDAAFFKEFRNLLESTIDGREPGERQRRSA